MKGAATPTFKHGFHALFLVLALPVAPLQILSSNSCLAHHTQPILQKQQSTVSGMTNSGIRLTHPSLLLEPTVSRQSGGGVGREGGQGGLR